MSSISADGAFNADEAVRHRLPGTRGGDMRVQTIESLADVAGEYDAFLLETYGILNIGMTAIPGARARVEALKGDGKRVLAVFNDASMPLDERLGKFRWLGFSFVSDGIVTSRTTPTAAIPGKTEIH